MTERELERRARHKLAVLKHVEEVSGSDSVDRVRPGITTPSSPCASPADVPRLGADELPRHHPERHSQDPGPPGGRRGGIGRAGRARQRRHRHRVRQHPLHAGAPAPGLWQLTPPTTRPAVRAGQEKAKPFFLTSNNQFDPGPPPALDSATYVKDLAESRRSAGRAPPYAGAALDREVLYPGITGFSAQITRQLVAGQPRASLAELSKLVAVLHTTSVDAQIHLAKTKYKYLFWRPFTAITTGSVNQDPTWTSLEVAPQHPEYPSGHALQGGAQQAVLDALVGRRSPVPVAVTSSNFAGQSRIYTDWATINQEIIDARVWEGVHFRNSDQVGSALGKKVAEYGLKRLYQIGL